MVFHNKGGRPTNIHVINIDPSVTAALDVAESEAKALQIICLGQLRANGDADGHIFLIAEGIDGLHIVAIAVGASRESIIFKDNFRDLPRRDGTVYQFEPNGYSFHCR